MTSDGIAGGSADKDFLTWHDLPPVRIWVHSRGGRDRRQELAIEVQWVGESPAPASAKEKALRLQLAAMRQTAGSDAALSAVALRSVPIGKVLETHSKLLASVAISSKIEERLLRLVKESTTSISDAKRTANRAALGLDASLPNAVLFAKLYADECALGSKKPVASIANRFEIDTKYLYMVLRVARSNGWLSSSGTGVSGGSLTVDGEEAWAKFRGDRLLTQFVSAAEGLKRG